MNSDFLDRFDKRQIRLMSLAVILIIAAVLVSYVILPKLRIYRSSVVTRDALVTTTNNADLIAAQLKMMQKEVNQLHRELHGDMDQMPAKQVESYVIGQLQDIFLVVVCGHCADEAFDRNWPYFQCLYIKTCTTQ